MRRPKPQPQDTRVPRLRDATPRGDLAFHERKARGQAMPRVAEGKNFRLRTVHAKKGTEP